MSSDPDFSKAIRRRIDLIPNQVNRAKVLAYHRERENEVKPQTLLSGLDSIVALARHLGERAWNEALRDDIITTISDHRFAKGQHNSKTAKMPTRKLAASTKHQWSIHLRTFYQWLLELDRDEKPPQFRRLPFPKVDAMRQRGSELTLKRHEVKQLLAGAQTTRDRLIIGLLLELGLRVSEAAAIRLDTVHVRPYGYQITLPKDEPGLKTGPREHPLGMIHAAPYLTAWLKEHPRRHEPRAPLLVAMSNRNQGSRMTGKTVSDVVARCAKRAGIRHIHAHMMRHTSATLKIAAGWQPELIRIVHGWSKESNMPSYYAHIDEHVEDIFLKANGLQTQNEELLDCMGTQRCGLCMSKNKFTDT